MNEHKANKTVLLFILNGLVSILVILFYKYISSSFSTDALISWMDEFTKKFALSVLVIFIILMLTAKSQLTVIGKLEKSYPWVLSVVKYGYIFILSGIMAIITSYYLEYFQMLKSLEATVQWIE
ncbi:MAG: hypothetical protein K6T88_19800, partial [Bacillus sp. (in: Bacteria)]|nr:hypothetical protein [Bacillus sp. (in: firmicutes)]